MPREAPEIRLIRESLEGVLHPSTASTVFFEALQEQGGALPTTLDDMRALVRGPLARGLAIRLGPEDAASLVTHVERMLEAIAPPPARAVRKRPSRHEEKTVDMMLSTETLPVYMLAGSSAFSDRLLAAVGPHVMSPLIISDMATLRARLTQIPPAFLLLDASDFPAIEPTELAAAIEEMPREMVRAIWGADLPYGMSLMDAALKRALSLTPFDRREGIEPLIDVIRSRRA